jgi:hypothetical protein
MRLRLLAAMVMCWSLILVVPAAHAAPRGTTTVLQAQASVPDERSAPVTVLLVGVGAVVGVVVGLIPALVAAVLLGYLPPPRLVPRRGGLLVEPARAGPAAVAPPSAPGPAPVARAALPEIPPAPGGGDGDGDEHPPGPIGVLAQARHQSVYDAAYAEQSERVDALRAAIGGRLRKRPPAPPGE